MFLHYEGRLEILLRELADLHLATDHTNDEKIIALENRIFKIEALDPICGNESII
jgi:hypothetical protein